jgi:hypothetical protein
MSDFVQEEPDNAEQQSDEEEPSPAAPRESEGWEETNDEPAQGEGGQDIV